MKRTKISKVPDHYDYRNKPLKTNIPESMYTVLTNDPSMTAWGWAVVTLKGVVIKTGAIKTEFLAKKKKVKVSEDRIRRIKEITKALLLVIKEYKIDRIVSEVPHGSQNASAAVMIGVVTGILQTFGDCLNIPVEWYYEGDCKKAISGKRSLSNKDEMVKLIDNRFTVPWMKWKWENQAIADALAVFNLAIKN